MAEHASVDLIVDRRGVATVKLNRPDKRNAMSGKMIRELAYAAWQLDSDASVRVVILAANGTVFCAGADLGWMKAQFEATPEGRKNEALHLAAMLDAWNRLSRPVIARVHGSAFGGGIGLMAVADVVFVNRDAEFSLTETRLGLIPATISPYVFSRIGETGARRTFLSGKRFNGGEAVRLGLASQALAIEDLDQAVEEEVDALLNCAPGAVADAKSLIRLLAGNSGCVSDQSTADRLVARWESAEAREGIASFFERRRPAWAKGKN